jgi:hypothetical protein
MELIYSYTRAQAIADGVLVDVSAQAKETGFRVPVALTCAVWEDCALWTEHDEATNAGQGQSTEGRLWDILTMAYLAATRTDGDRAPFSLFRVPRNGDNGSSLRVDLVLTIHPGDEGEPVCTIMLPDED